MNDQNKTKQQLIDEAAELRQSLDALINNLPEGFFIVDSPDVRLRLASRYGWEMIGVSKEELEGARGLEHFRHYEVYCPDGSVAKREALPLHRAMHFGEVIRNEEWLFQVADGKRIPILCHAGPVRNEKGDITGAVISWQDISERKRVEETLRQSERKFHSLFDDSAVAMGVISPDAGYILHVNRAFCEHFGYSEEELLGTTVESITYPGDMSVSMQAIERAVESGPRTQRFEKRYLHKSGRLIWGEVNYSLVRDAEGKPAYFIAQVLDITERKQAEEALQKAHNELERRVLERTAELAEANRQLQREIEDRKAIEETLRRSEEKHRGLLTASPDSVVQTDLNGTIVFASRQAAQLVGLSDADELVGKSVGDFLCEHDKHRLAANILDLIEKHIRKHTEYTVIRCDGTTLPVEVSSALNCDAEGRPVAVMAVIRDIAERKQAQDALERERQSLWRMLQASDHERQTISYEIHDGIAQYLAAAMMQFQAHDSQKKNFPGKAKKAYDTALELVRQAHSESRRLISEVRPPVIDESGLETAISHLICEQRREGGPKIECRTSLQNGRLPAIMENALYRIAQEALTNACGHSKSKKVKVTLTQEKRDIRLEVRDWGIGFDSKSIAEGHFGLEGIRERVRLLGGKASIESVPGSGTLVQVVVPVLEMQGNT